MAAEAFVPRTAVLELEMTIDEAIRYIVSCGVLVPELQAPDAALSSGPPLTGRTPSPAVEDQEDQDDRLTTVGATPSLDVSEASNQRAGDGG